MSKVANTQFGTGRVVDEQRDRMGRVSYKVEGDGWSTWVEASALVEASTPFPYDERPTTVDYENSTTLPYNPRPQYPAEVYTTPLSDLRTTSGWRSHSSRCVMISDSGIVIIMVARTKRGSEA